MKIGILSKKTTGMTGLMKEFFENAGHIVTIYTLKNLCINEALFENDLFILKSKKIIYIYAGHYLEKNNIPVIPNPNIIYNHKNRIEAHYLIKKTGLILPEFYFGKVQTLLDQLKPSDFPLILKPIMGSGSRGVKKITSFGDLKPKNDQPLYLEKYIKGTHYLVYFIDDEMCILEKPPLSNEHVDMKEILINDDNDDIREVVIRWKNHYNLLFGHLDIVREHNTDKIYIVDPGSFPEFSNWRCDKNPAPKICNLILKRYEYLKLNNHKIH